MSVKILTEIQKNVIAQFYSEKTYSTSELAQQYHVSRRTIQRVLVECHVARTPRLVERKPKTITAPAVNVLTPEKQIPLQFEPELSFIQKSVQLFKQLIAKLFPTTNHNANQ